MSVPHRNLSEAPSDLAEAAGPIHVPRRYKVALGILLLSLVIVGLLAVQQVNLLQLQNSQLSSRASSLSGNVSDLNKIVNLQKSQVLADNQSIFWAAGTTGVPLDWSCQCFQYSGFLHMNWNSKTDLSLRVTQFGLNLTTPSMPDADFKVPVSGYVAVTSSGKPAFVASFVMAGCPVQGGCTATYSAVYHY